MQFWKQASCHVLTSGFTVLEGSGSWVFGGEASPTGEAGSTAGFRLECAQGTELTGRKAVRRIFSRLAQTWRTNDPSERGPGQTLPISLQTRSDSGQACHWVPTSAPASVREALAWPAAELEQVA